MTFRPPYRSAQIPKLSRSRAPERIDTATIHSSCESDSPNAARRGSPRIPSISQTLNISVKAPVESHRTRRRADGVKNETGEFMLLTTTRANAHGAGFVRGLARVRVEDGVRQLIHRFIVHGNENLAGTHD